MSTTLNLGPMAEIARRLADFAQRLQIWSVTAFTIDGYVVGHRVSYDNMPP